MIGVCSSRIAALMASTAWPSATPWARLNEIVTAGNWLWWLIDSGAVLVLSTFTKVESGTAWPVLELTYSLSSTDSDLLLLRQHFHDQVVGVHLGEILRHLALAERVVQRVVDHLRLDAEARGGVAVDGQHRGGAAVLLVGGHVAQLRQGAQLVEDLRRPVVQLGGVGVLQGELVQRLGRPAADAHVLAGLQEQLRALDLGKLRAQPGDDLLGGRVPLRRTASAR